MTYLPDNIESDLNDLYNLILIDEADSVKETYKRIQITQNDLDNYINFYKSHMHLTIEDANKLIIRYHEDLKHHTSKLYDLIKRVNKYPQEKTDMILRKLSSYLDDIEKEIRNWEEKI